MARQHWIRLYDEILKDENINNLPDRLWRRFIELLLLARNDGHLPRFYTIAWKLHLDESELKHDLRELIQRGLVIIRYRSPYIPKSLINKFRKDNTLTESKQMRRKINSAEIKEKLIKRRGHKCEICGCIPGYLELDHIVPLWKGGTNEYKNLQLLCHECHRQKTKDDMSEYYESRGSNGKQ